MNPAQDRPAQTRPAAGQARGHAPASQTRRFGPPPATQRRRRTAEPQQAPRPRPARPAARKASRRRRELVLGRLHNRITTSFAAVCLLLAVIGGRLVQLQGLDYGGYAGAAAAGRSNSVALNALRGQILDRDGTPLAYTTDAQDITVDPTQVKPAARERYAEQLAPLVDSTPADVVKALSTPGHYAVLARALSPIAAKKVADLGLDGIYTQATTQRQYPGQTTGANIIGLVHSDGTGAAGIEDAYNSVLAGTNGSLTYTVDGNGNINPNGPSSRTSAVDGGTVRLTVDQSLQYMTQQYADTAVKQSGAKGAEVAILAAKSGRVLALASSGTYNSADPNTLNPDVPMDPPVMSVFEPGSVNKVVTFAAAVDKGTITPSTVVNVPTVLEMGGVTVHDAWWHPAENFTATGILAESSNIGTLMVARKLGPQTWFDYEKAFGVGTATGIELPGESSGYLPPMDTWSDSSFANLPFGQGESLTVLQLAGMYQTIANDGLRIPPRIVSSVTKSDGSVTATRQPPGVRVVSPETARTVRTMLESTMLPGGTGTKAAIPGYRIAGKTGTAQQPDPAHGGAYSTYLNWDTFAGIVPADNPQFVVAIMVDAPAHGLEGGDVAAPLFHEIATYEAQHANIPPTGSRSLHVPSRYATPSPGKTRRVPSADVPNAADAANAAPAAAAGLPRPARARPQRLSALAALAGGALTGADVAVRGMTSASVRVHEGDLFAGVPGAHGHGARFAPDALAAGAVAVLTDPAGARLLAPEVPAVVVPDARAVLGTVAARVYGDPSSRLDVLGVTGTSGKTTTTYLVRAGLAAAGWTCGLIGTVATQIGDETIKTGFTTPEAPDLQALLAVMAERGASTVSMEVSSHALAMGRADGIDFAVAAFTNLSQDHLDFHAGMEDYFAAKARLFDGRARWPVIVTDDVWGHRMATAVGPCTTVSATGDPATWRAVEVQDLADGSTRFRVLGPGVDLVTGCAIPGRYNVANALLALAILDAAGLPAPQVADAVATGSVPGRMQRVEEGQPFLAVVDYSHKPAAVEGALCALRPLTAGRLIVVLGCGGDRDRGKRPLMGEVAAAGSDLLIVTDDNPRSEDAAAIRRAMLDGALAATGRGEVLEVGERAAAIVAAVGAARPGDTVLVAGKGHETGQEVAGVVHPFDDVDELRRAIRAANP